MIVKSKSVFTNNHEEILPMHMDSFPYLCMSAELTAASGHAIAWHWHSAFEVDYIEEGEVTFSTSQETISLSKGAAIFLNSNMLHAVSVEKRHGAGKIYAHFWTRGFVAGETGTDIDKKYVAPLIGNETLPFFCLYPDRKEDRYMLQIIADMKKIGEEEPDCYELEIRKLVSSFWQCMYLRFPEAWRVKQQRNVDEERMKEMLRYIRKNYGEKLTVKEIAAAANIGTRECARCFGRTIGVPPMQYLAGFRIEKAAEQLMESSESITTISEKCGFSTQSYFGECFKNRYGCTPKEYRRQSLQNEGGREL